MTGQARPTQKIGLARCRAKVREELQAGAKVSRVSIANHRRETHFLISAGT